MLKHLRITNFAILSDVAIDFAPGFNVLTGETGAGKSLIVDAVALLRGARASADIPRAGADEAVVEAVFEPPPDMRAVVGERLESAGLRPLEDEIIVRRVISRGGRSRVHVNGGLTTAAALGELGAVLVDLSGQHEHQGLSDPSRHLTILDAFGVEPALGAAAHAAYEQLREIASALAEKVGDDRSRSQREDFLRFQIEELDAAKPVAGEETEMAGERERLRSAGKLAGAARRGEERLYTVDGSVVDVLTALCRELEPLATIDGRLTAPTRELGEARALCEDAAEALRRYADGLADDPQRLGEIDDRLHLLHRLCRKHAAADAAELAAVRERMQAELDGLAQYESRRAALEKELGAARSRAVEAARALTAAREKAARRLEKAAAEALGEMHMAGARLSVALGPRVALSDDAPDVAAALAFDASEAGVARRLGPRGWDRVELLLGANKGEEPRPLAKIASGGELSRIMLALKLALKHADAVGTYVFDEVDTGVGGAIAEVVGRQIRRVAQARQVICVTHLAQIAALADAQFRVEKFEKDGRVETAVSRLPERERREELARMLGGLKITAKTRAHAEELLRQARDA